MNIGSIKTIVIKVALAVVVALVLYSVFWFFKIGQFEKQINRFVGDNSSNVSIGSFEVSGYPFSQKVTISNLRFSLPTAALNHHQIIVSSLEISGGIFDAVFDVNLSGNVLVQDQKGASYSLTFNGKPQIKIAVADGFLSSLSYQDKGHKVVDGAQNLIYSASSSNVTIDSAMANNGQITFTINSNVREVENFGVFDIYKHAFEQKLIDAIKTGQVTIVDNQAAVQEQVAGQDLNAPAATAQQGAPVAANPSSNNATTAVVNAAIPAAPSAAALPAAQVKDSAAKVAVVNSESKVAAPVVVPAQGSSAEVAPVAEGQQVVDAAAINQAIQAEAAMPNVKTDFALSAKYILSPGASNQQVPMNVAQMQENSSQYSKSLKITNFSITNSLYAININGDINILPDDTMPSGGISVRVEKFSDVINYTNQIIAKISQKAFSDSVNQALPVEASTNPVAESAKVAANTGAGAAAEVENSLQDFANNEAYHNFLNRISPNFADVVKQVATKNPVTTGEVAQFDIRREKNLEFLVNETPIREILGKF